MYCLKPAIQDVPPGRWFCNACQVHSYWCHWYIYHWLNKLWSRLIFYFSLTSYFASAYATTTYSTGRLSASRRWRWWGMILSWFWCPAVLFAIPKPRLSSLSLITSHAGGVHRLLAPLLVCLFVRLLYFFIRYYTLALLLHRAPTPVKTGMSRAQIIRREMRVPSAVTTEKCCAVTLAHSCIT